MSIWLKHAEEIAVGRELGKQIIAARACSQIVLDRKWSDIHGNWQVETKVA